MSEATYYQADNAQLGVKLDIRRRLLSEFHGSEPISVFDACQGDGEIWGVLKDEFNVSSYFGVDKKRASGRLQVDSVRILRSTKWTFDVIDVDTYGSPWGHYRAIIENMTRPVTVFLTCGAVASKAGMTIPKDWARCVGMPDNVVSPLTKRRGLYAKVYSKTARHALWYSAGRSIIRTRILASRRTQGAGFVDYIGLRIELGGGQ